MRSEHCMRKESVRRMVCYQVTAVSASVQEQGKDSVSWRFLTDSYDWQF